MNDMTVAEAATRLRNIFGPPNDSGFGSALFSREVEPDTDLESLALDHYRQFVGPQWARWGEETWLGPWKQVHSRADNGPIGVIKELESIDDPDARRSLPLVLEAGADPAATRKALTEAFDHPEISRFSVWTVGDGAAMSGLLLAGVSSGLALVLVTLMD